MQLVGDTQDDAAGEAFDKVAKLLGLPYPGGPEIDRLAKQGNAAAYHFPHPKVPGYNFSFSGLKTAILYFLQKQQALDTGFIKEHLASICASVQSTIVEILAEKTLIAAKELKIKQIAISGGVSANSALRQRFATMAADEGWDLFIPPMALCTDNAAMIAVTGYYKYLKGDFTSQQTVPEARFSGLD
jgi:N6-L-threonylcarbamoyladenine synthase